MDIYANHELFDWFKKEYAKHFESKLNMGKRGIRFKNVDDIPDLSPVV